MLTEINITPKADFGARRGPFFILKPSNEYFRQENPIYIVQFLNHLLNTKIYSLHPHMIV
jgi:hypothetical protein